MDAAWDLGLDQCGRGAPAVLTPAVGGSTGTFSFSFASFTTEHGNR